MTTIALALIWFAVGALLVRVVVGPSLADRVVALDGALVAVVSGLAVSATRTGVNLFSDVAVVIGLLGFVGTAVAARFIERRGPDVRVLGQVLLVAGAVWTLLAAVGVVRLDDVYARMHAATKSTTLGLWLVLGGAATQLAGEDAAKLALVGVLIFLAAPAAAHLVGRAVHHAPGDARIRIDTVDELRDADPVDD